MPGHARHFFQRGTDRLGDQFQPGEIAHCGQDMGGVGPLCGAFTHEPGILEPNQREVQEQVGTVAHGEALAEVGQHAVVEAGIIEFQREGVFEVDAAAHRLGGLPVRQTE